MPRTSRKDFRTLELPLRGRGPKEPVTPAAAPANAPPLPGAFEHGMELDDVIDHLKAKRRRWLIDKRGPEPPDPDELCTHPFHCDLWPIEQTLIEDLESARRDGQPDKINRMRALIRAISWRTYPRTAVEPAELRDSVRHFLDSAFQEYGSKIKTSKKNEVAEQELRGWQTVHKAIHKTSYGEEAEQACGMIEDKIAKAWRRLEAVLNPYGISWSKLPAAVLTSSSPDATALRDLLKFAKRREFAWRELSAEDYEGINRWVANKSGVVLTAISEIKNLRPLRDQLYAQRLFPHWFSAVKK